MTKAEAIDALSQGQKVTHYYFTDDEWMKESDGFYKFEDDAFCPIEEFWKIRQLEGWQDGWELFNNS